MQDRLCVLFDKINLSDDYKSYFNNAILSNVKVDPNDKSWTIIIDIDNILPVDVYNHLLASIQTTFINDKVLYIYLSINPKNINYELLTEYYYYVIDKLEAKSPNLSLFKDRKIECIEDKYILELHNKAEYNKFNKIKKDMNNIFNLVGFKNIDLELIINEQHREVIKQEITKSKEIKIEAPKKEEDGVILGNKFKGKPFPIKDIIGEENDVCIEAYIFGADYFESSKSDFKIITLKVTDYSDSIYVKVFTRDSDEFSSLSKKLSAGKWVKIKGYTKNDIYSKDLVLNARDINEITKEEIKDDYEQKRVELHTHTHMSQMDGLISAKDLIKRAKKWGHKAIAITDHNGVQSFPDAFHEAKDIKVIYGVELNLIDDSIDIVFRENDSDLKENTYVVFDFETTGFNAGGGDSIIEIGAVKLHNGEIIDRFSKLINPHKPLSKKITEVTGITDDMLKDASSEEEVVKEFMVWTYNLPMVAHNAKFDASFLEMAYKKYNMGEYTNPLIDTLELSRAMDPAWGRHGLSQLVKRYEIPFDEDSHHRGVYDAEATALIFNKMIKKLTDRNIDTLNKIKNLVPKEDLHKLGTMYHVNILAKDNTGLKNLFKIVSLANTKYLYKTPRILRSKIEKYREGLLIGSSCSNGEVFLLARSKTEEELANIMSFYDYIEIQPLSVYDHLLQMNDFANLEELKDNIRKIIKVANDAGKIVVATGDVHHLDEKDKIYREVIVNQKVPGGGRHPLARDSITNIPSQHFRTTKEMLDEFNFLGEELANKIVIENSNFIADSIDNVTIIKDQLYSPKMENSDTIVKDIVYTTAKSMYGEVLPTIIEERLEKELHGIIGGGFDVIYLIAQKLVKKSNDDGYLVGSRGSVGSSLVATMLGITEVNPLPAHYICQKCKTAIFEEEGVALGATYSSGYDLPDKKCSCGEMMSKEGQDMPFATFLGFKADKVPDIDLNFSGEYQAKAHDYTKELFGEDNVFRAGTIGTVADKTAFGFSKGYMEDKGLQFRTAEIERLATGCTGVKRTTGQHPGGIIVIPNYMDIYDFSPYQYPADDASSRWYTTHFDFHAIHDNVLKLDILGHDDPTVLRMLQDLSGINIQTIPFDDKRVLSLFSSPDTLGVNKDQIMCETGTLGVPEFGTKFVIQMLMDTKPTTFAELVKISGLSHGTDVWLGNAQELIKNNVCEFKDVIGCRDDIMVYLMYHGLEPGDAFKIMEFVRKGMPSKKPDDWKAWDEVMRNKGIKDWYIESCRRIKYMFPKAHATAYVMMGYRVAWFKVHHPILYYAAYFSIRCSDFDIETMIKGYDTIKNKIIEISNKGYDASNKDSSIKDVLELALEMTARGFRFSNIDLYKSDSTKFIIAEDNKTLIPPFRTIDGLGETVAKNIVEERQKGAFISIEDLQKRAKISTTLIDKMRVMGILQGMPESSQLTLF
jgi:DNA polymerase III subunit alpha, Gram-positive type